MGAVLLPTLAACTLVGKSLDGLSGGQNGEPCGATSITCAGGCVDSQSNLQNCGGCGNACKTGEVCSAGQCTVACPGGEVGCNGLCYDLTNDLQHCGKCDAACRPGEVCGNGQCAANCPMGQTNCGGSCADLQTDPKHCGDCATACGANEECDAGKCAIACKTQLNQPITDPWGYSWDGLERAATGFATAKATCEAFRGRLPIASELYRVSATQSATVGQTIHTNFLWSLVPYGAGAHIEVRLSDAATLQAANTAPLNYRCVCPPPPQNAYLGRNCFGPAAGACYGLESENKRVNIDLQDRAPMPKGSAVWECGFARGRLASPRALAEAIQQGVGPGTDRWLHSADEVHFQDEALVRWSTGAGFVFAYTGGGTNALAWAPTTNTYPFRCVGDNYAAGPHPAAIADEWVGGSGRKSTTKDQPAAAYVDANDKCFAAGGHLPTTAELAQLVDEGLPNGSNQWLWSSDQVGFDGTNFLVAIKRWIGTDLTHLFAWTMDAQSDLAWAYKNPSADATLRPYRCIFYPVDAAYAGPPTAQCAGGCTPVALGGASGAKVWIDSNDRAPVAVATGAIDACRKIGGHLASERDLLEGIRNGLPNGQAGFIFTSDAELGVQTTNARVMLGLSKWTAADAKYDDMWPNYTTWGDPTAQAPYRCVWTNELR